MNEKKLVRPKKGRVLFGVSAALGNYFDIDPVVIRIIFIVLTVWGGAGIILYIIGVFLIPSEEGEKEKNAGAGKPDKEEIKERVEAVAEEVRKTAQDKTNQNRGGIIFGLIILLLGVIFLFSNFFPWFGWGKLWPLILVAFGLLILLGGKKAAK